MPLFNVAVTPTALSANTNDWALNDGSFYLISSTTAVNVTGMTGGVNGKIRTLRNDGSNNITFVHQSASSTAANRFANGQGNDIIVESGTTISFQYDATASRWLLIGQTVGPFARTKVDVFTASGTWTKSNGAKSVHVVMRGGGGGGGSGRKGAAGSARGGGGGGGGGGYAEIVLSASLLGSTETVTVGASVIGGTAVSTSDTNGTDGQAGNPSIFGTWARANGGIFGFGGTTSGGTGGTGGEGPFTGQTGGAGGATAAGSTPTAIFTYGGRGGGGGGGIDTGDTAFAGGASNSLSVPYTAAAGSAGGTGAAGGAGESATNFQGGSAGGGGGASTAGNGGAGGAGGNYGHGGGGGGAAVNAVGNSGAGGTGAAGIVIVTTYF